MLNFGIAFAAETAAQMPPRPPEMGFMGSLLPFILMFVVFWFLLIRPQQKKMKEQQSMQESLKKGVEVITQSGLYGKITGVTEKVVTLEIASNVRVKMLKSQVLTVVQVD